jgi:hypothetical protein
LNADKKIGSKQANEVSSHEKRKKRAKKEEIVLPVIIEEEPVQQEDIKKEIEEDLSPKPKSARKSKKSSAEFKKKDPNRYVNKFKTVGKYEKIPKSETIEEEDEDEETPEIDNQSEDNEVEDASIEIAEPIEVNVEEDQQDDEDHQSADEETPGNIEIHVLPKQGVDDEKVKDTHANKVDISDVSLQEKVQCKYRTSCYETGKLPDLAEENKQAKVRETLIVHSPVIKQEDDELSNKVACKYRKSCYSQQQEAKPIDDKDVANKKKVDEDRKVEVKPVPTQKSKKDDDEEVKTERINQTVVNLDSLSTADKLDCKYR